MSVLISLQYILCFSSHLPFPNSFPILCSRKLSPVAAQPDFPLPSRSGCQQDNWISRRERVERMKNAGVFVPWFLLCWATMPVERVSLVLCLGSLGLLLLLLHFASHPVVLQLWRTHRQQPTSSQPRDLAEFGVGCCFPSQCMKVWWGNGSVSTLSSPWP